MQLFCTNGSDPSCGPTRFGPPPPPLRLRNGARCLVVTNASSFPCSGAGVAAGCPAVMGDCGDASALWTAAAAGALSRGSTLTSADPVLVAAGGVVLDVDCNAVAPHTVVKALASGAASITLTPEGRLQVAGGAACFNTGQGPANKPCGPPGEVYLDSQIQLTACDDADAQGWAAELAW